MGGESVCKGQKEEDMPKKGNLIDVKKIGRNSKDWRLARGRENFEN